MSSILKHVDLDDILFEKEIQDRIQYVLDGIGGQCLDRMRQIVKTYKELPDEIYNEYMNLWKTVEERGKLCQQTGGMHVHSDDNPLCTLRFPRSDMHKWLPKYGYKSKENEPNHYYISIMNTIMGVSTDWKQPRGIKFESF